MVSPLPGLLSALHESAWLTVTLDVNSVVTSGQALQDPQASPPCLYEKLS